MKRTDDDSRAVGRCPICGAPYEAQYRPFCSRRCADVDLSRWLRGAYAIPVQGEDDEEDGSDGGSGAARGGQGAGQPGGEEL
jgi:endogenous inhibitor of DNA gyrase (YacG/DUF329 family)